MDVAQIADKLNDLAATLGPELLPNGYKSGNKWMFSGIADTGLSASAWLDLSGASIGHWRDAGNCAAGEERGDMIDLLRLIRCGGDQRAAIGEAKRILGIEDDFAPGRKPTIEDEAARVRREAESAARAAARERRDASERADKERGAKAMWLGDGAVPIAGTPAEAYLMGRGIYSGGKWPGALRYRGEVPHKPTQSRYPAMLAAGYDAGGQMRFVQRYWLRRDDQGRWTKIDHELAKMALGSVWGNFVPINKGASGKPMAAMPDGEAVYVTEGIEDACVVRMVRPELRVIAALNLANIGGIVLPPAARRMVIVADRDEHPRAQDALERAIAAQQARGIEVRMVMPPEGAKDVNDWLRAGRAPMRGRAA